MPLPLWRPAAALAGTARCLIKVHSRAGPATFIFPHYYAACNNTISARTY